MPAAAASRYAQALADLVLKPGSRVDPEQALTELASLASVLKGAPQLQHVLLSPSVPTPRKRALIGRLVAALGVSDLVRRFLLVMVGHRRIDLLEEAGEAFEMEIDARRGVVRVDVASPRELTAAEREALSRELAGLTGRQPRLRFRLEPGLIGGLVARVGSTVYDGSVRGQLEGMRHRLAGGH
jgi:F-type H+-transporting ATPase subunit delta